MGIGLVCGLTALLAVLLGATSSSVAAGWAEELADVNAYGTAAEELTETAALAYALELVNAARQEEGGDPLRWDVLAAECAARHARDMLARNYSGHVDLGGRKVQARFNALGGLHHSAENLSTYRIEAEVHRTPQLVERVVRHWLDSAAHRVNLLDPAHTHVGMAIVLTYEGDATRVAAVQVFINAYGEYAQLPVAARRGEVVTIRGRLNPGTILLCAGIGIEPPAAQAARAAAQPQAATYRDPAPVLALLPREYAGRWESWVARQRYTVDYSPQSGEFSAELRLAEAWPPGQYHVTVWVQTEELDRVCAMTQVVDVD